MALNFPYPTPKWLDGDFTVATPVSLPVFSSPIPATTKEYTFTQDFIQLRNSFVPLTLNARHFDPKYNDYFLVGESPRTDQGGGVVRWTRTYSQVPDTYDDFESYVYNFIGFAQGGDANSLNAPGRNRQSLSVPSRLRYEFFITDPKGITNPPDGRIYTDPGRIPLLQPLSYWLVDQQFPTRNPTPWTVDVIEDSPPFNQPTSPRLTSYRTWINNAITYGFSGDTVDGFDPEGDRFFPATQPWKNLINPSQFPVEQSTLKRWQGSIWVRITRTVLAK